METQGFDICSFLGFWVTLEILSSSILLTSTMKSLLFVVLGAIFVQTFATRKKNILNAGI